MQELAELVALPSVLRLLRRVCLNFGSLFTLALLVLVATDEIAGGNLLLFLSKQTVRLLAEKVFKLPREALLGCGGALIGGQACGVVPRASSAIV